MPLSPAALAESAPERDVVSLQFLDDLDSQPGADRSHVKAPSVRVVGPPSGTWSISGSLISDAISGGVRPVPRQQTDASKLTPMKDQRRAGTFDLTR